MGSTNSISGSQMGAKMYFEYSSTYDPATNTSTVSVHPYYTTDIGTGGTNIYGGDLYGNGSSIYSMSSGYAGDYILTVPNTSGGGWAYCSVRSGSIRSFTVQHNNSGNASFTCGFSGKARAMYDGTTANFSSSTGCSGSIYQARTLNVSYNANGGSGSPAATYFYGTTEGITLSTGRPTRTGYTFLGWSTDASATVATYSPGQYIGTRTSSLVLYAVWQINTFAIDYNANGGEGAPESQTKTYGQTLVLSDVVPTRTGYTFMGWATTSGATAAQYQPGGEYTANEAATLYAVWRLTTYTLHISQGVGSQITVEKQGNVLADGSTITHGDTLTIRVSPNIGYDITGLTVNSSPISSGDSYRVSSDTTVESSASVKQFSLSKSEGTGTVITVTRTYSPLGGAALGELNDGATLYHSDVISIEVSTAAGYILQTATMNGGSIQSPYSVSAGVILVATAIAAGAYIRGGSSFDMYQILIKGQQSWDLYRPVAYNGTSWENY